MQNIDIDLDINSHNNCSTVCDIDEWFQSKKYCQDGLLIIHLNIRSIKKHWDEFLVVIQKLIGIADIIVLCEIALKEYEKKYYLDGYQAHYKLREGK